MNINETKIKVRYVETDQMGIVHHSNYYAWFEVGRTEFIKESGISYSDMESNGIMMPLVESNCRYMVGAKYEDEVTIKTWVEELNGAKVVFLYEVIRAADNITLARGKTVHAFVNKDFKIINLKKTNTDIWNKIQGLL